MTGNDTRTQKRMDAIRAARGLPPLRSLDQLDREQMMERVAAARTYIDRTGIPEDRARRLELSAFMAIFHPEVPDDRVRQMMRVIAP